MLWGEGEDKFSIESVCLERKREERWDNKTNSFDPNVYQNVCTLNTTAVVVRFKDNFICKSRALRKWFRDNRNELSIRNSKVTPSLTPSVFDSTHSVGTNKEISRLESNFDRWRITEGYMGWYIILRIMFLIFTCLNVFQYHYSSYYIYFH